MKNSLNNLKLALTITNQKAKELGLAGIIKASFADLFLGRNWRQWLYLILLGTAPIWIELLGGGITTDWLGMIASITGILCVILVSEQRYSNYLFGLINSAIYFWLCLTAEGGAFYGELLTTAYFLICQPLGFLTWMRVNHSKTDTSQDDTGVVKSLDLAGWLKMIGLTVATWLLMGFAYQSIGSNRPYRDSVTDGTNVTGQLLMNRYYWEQWLFWIATNLFSIYLWWDNSLQMQGMYWVYTLNSLVGWYKWYQDAKKA